MKLHIGCFDRPALGWYNTDITPHLFLAKIPFLPWVLHLSGKLSLKRFQQHKKGVFKEVHYLNVSKRFPFESGSVDAVFSSHVIEHLPRRSAKNMLAESFRVLKKGGVCRVVAPSLEYAVAIFDPEDPTAFLDMVFESNQVGEKNRHQWMYTSSSLVAELIEAGFVDVKVCSYRSGRLPDVELMDNRPDISIFVEGLKP